MTALKSLTELFLQGLIAQLGVHTITDSLLLTFPFDDKIILVLQRYLKKSAKSTTMLKGILAF